MIKEFRERLGNDRHNTIQEYSDAFIGSIKTISPPSHDIDKRHFVNIVRDHAETLRRKWQMLSPESLLDSVERASMQGSARL